MEKEDLAVADTPKAPRKRTLKLANAAEESAIAEGIGLIPHEGQDAVLPPPKSDKKGDYRFCKHENLRKDKYGKVESVFQPGKGMITHCADCGVKITSFHISSQPNSRPTKSHMSKKDRRLGRKIQKEIKSAGLDKQEK